MKNQNANVAEEAQKPAKPATVKAVGYKVATCILFLFAIGGLFLGMISKVLDFVSSPISPAVGKWYDGSFIGFAIEQITALTTPAGFNALLPSASNGGIPAMILRWIPVIFTVFFAFLAIIAIICLIAALVPQRVKEGKEIKKSRAAKCMYALANMIVLTYGGIFLYTFIATTPIPKFALELIDLPAALVFFVALVTLTVAGIGRRKGLGFANFIVCILSIAAFLGFAFPASETSALGFANLLSYIFEKQELFLCISLFISLVVLVFNLLASIFRLGAKKGYLFDVIRFALQLITIVLTVVAYYLATKGIAIITSSLIAFILWTVATVAALVFAIILLATRAAKARKEEEEEENVPPQTNVYVTIPASQLPAAAPAPTPAPVASAYTPAPVPVEQPAAQPAPQPATYAQPAPMYPQPAPQPTILFVSPSNMTVTPANSANAQPTPTPAPAPTPAPVATVAEPAQEAPMSEFELRMQELARGNSPAKDRTPAAPVDYSAAYTYDAFMNSLTVQEKNEFGDLFIANKYGVATNLPTYVISGDNREFFSKVFIYLGRFRQYASQGLIEKLYDYVSKN